MPVRIGYGREIAVTPGYIYILQNASLAESHLKIGRTTVHPNSRASDLSRATGVPTPFVVVWYSETCDCILAEKIIHEHLAECRTNPRREFFDIELSQAIIVAEYAVERAGARATSSSVAGSTGGIVASVFSWGWNVTIAIINGTCYTIWFFLKLFATFCFTLCMTLPFAILTGILSGISKPPRRRRKRQWWE